MGCHKIYPRSLQYCYLGPVLPCFSRMIACQRLAFRGNKFWQLCSTRKTPLFGLIQSGIQFHYPIIHVNGSSNSSNVSTGIPPFTVITNKNLGVAFRYPLACIILFASIVSSLVIHSRCRRRAIS